MTPTSPPSEDSPRDRGKRRFPKSVYSVGNDPDPRFSLANERTFLAWLRTSLAFIAAGVALEALGFPESDGFRSAGALVFVVIGIAAAVRAWTGWVRTETALRKNEPLPSIGIGLILVVGIVIGVTLVALGMFL
jgi:putative membrane protein